MIVKKIHSQRGLIMEYYISQIALFPYGYAPRGWMLCDGRTLVIQSNMALYSLLEVRFGGDGKTNFKIPDLSNVSPVAENTSIIGSSVYYICYQGLYPGRP